MSLAQAVAPFLPKDVTFRVLHLCSATYKTKNLCCVKKKQTDRPQTYKNKQFMALIDADLQIIIGLEIYVYIICTGDATTHHMFISKADTTGLSLYKVKIADVVRAMVAYVDSTDIQKYAVEVETTQNGIDIPRDIESPAVAVLNAMAKQLRTDPSYYHSIVRNKITATSPIAVNGNVIHRISLFTRASAEYLFPESADNKNKHVINGSQLLKWWITILDKVTSQSPQKWLNYLQIPGSDREAIRKYISSARTLWNIGSLFDENTTLPAIYTIPLLPDDPKGRFLEHLVVEGRWKHVHTKAFWQELGFRQEFRIGNVVGIIGSESTEEEKTSYNEPPVPIQRRKYRQLIKEIKRTDFSEREDVQRLVDTEIPNLVGDVYEVVVGTQSAVSTPQKRAGPAATNITGLVKRKKPRLEQETQKA